MPVKIIETSEFDLKKPILVEGFPGIGLVGTIASSYLVEKLKMDLLGHITSEKFPPIAAVHNKIPLHPARIYKSQKNNLLVLFSEFIIPLQSIHDLSEKILDWCIEREVKEIISLGGIVLKDQGDVVFGIASTPKLVEQLEANGIKTIKEGATTGVSGVLLADCYSRKFPAVSLLADSKPEFLDPKAAALVIEALKKLINVKVSTEELVCESVNIEGRMKEIMYKARDAHSNYKKVEEIGPMYG
ncbi:MAG: proteasome assembly chaperone family protein [Candidatus Micrarchaeota archaeon]|nr:proteasome assembly chaperone family protein [Candidatus Micrarchaeota archaeon]